MGPNLFSTKFRFFDNIIGKGNAAGDIILAELSWKAGGTIVGAGSLSWRGMATQSESLAHSSQGRVTDTQHKIRNTTHITKHTEHTP